MIERFLTARIVTIACIDRVDSIACRENKPNMSRCERVRHRIGRFTIQIDVENRRVDVFVAFLDQRDSFARSGNRSDNACSSAFQHSSRKSRCCGSIHRASRGAQWKNSGSN